MSTAVLPQLSGNASTPEDEHPPIVWCDVETTGLSHEWDQVLEVAFVVTDSDLEILGAYTEVVHWPELVSMKPVVREMHTRTGLLDEVYMGGKALSEISDEVIAFLKRNAVTDRSPLAGSTVHFDRGFIKRDMPEVLAMIHYRNLDVSSLKELIKRWHPGAEWKKADRHRALPDILDSIKELNHYRRVFGLDARGE
jgi:oligoribonuclease